MGWITCGGRIRGINPPKEDEIENNDKTLDCEQNTEKEEESDDNAKTCDCNGCDGNCGNCHCTNHNS